MSETSTKPYLLRAIYEWCTDNGYTPYIAAMVDASTRVPREFVKNGEIVLNISFSATSALKMENDFIHFNARFGGVSREIAVPVANVVAIYASENGQGMAFEVPRVPASGNEPAGEAGDDTAAVCMAARASAPNLASVPSGEAEAADSVRADDPKGDSDPPKAGGRPRLTRIK